MKKKFLFLLYTILIFNSGVNAQDAGSVSKILKNASREDHYRIPFLYLKGNDYEVGYQYGYLLKNELNSFYNLFKEFKEEMLDKEISYLPWYTRFFANIFGGMVFRHKINNYADKLPADILLQIQGASESSGLPDSFFKELLVFADLFSDRCEGVIIIKNDHTYHAHNLDQFGQLNLISQFPVVVNYDIKGKQKYTDLGFTGLLMPTTAFNESGITISENGNNFPLNFNKDECTLFSSKRKLITDSHNLREVDSIAKTLNLPRALILILSSANEKKAVVCDLIGPQNGITCVNGYQFVGNRTISNELGKKSQTFYSGRFHEEARIIKFNELIDTSKQNIVDELIGILSNTDFYHYKDQISVHIESLHNYETDQSVIFDLKDSTVYFTYYPHFAAWNKWIKYNFITHKVSVYKDIDPKLNDPILKKLDNAYKEYEYCDWRDSTNVRAMMDTLKNSKIENYFSLSTLSQTYIDYYKDPQSCIVYANKLIDKYPDVSTGYFLKGRGLEYQNLLKDASACYLQACECKINCELNSVQCYEHLAFLYDKLDDKNVAKDYATKAMNIYNQYWQSESLVEKVKKLNEIKDR